MEEKEIILKPIKEKKNILTKINGLFEDKKRRYLYLALFVLPFLIIMGIFGFIAFRDAKELINLAKGQSVVNEENIIRSMNYVLRDNATDVQKEYFAELKQAIEVDNASDEVISGLVCKNYIADLYTWTNKQGQYDVSALYYVYTPQKNDIYLQIRDGFYKYLNNYINDYGTKNLIEVESVEVVSTSAATYDYVSASDEVLSEIFNVTCKWTYVPGSKLDTSKFATQTNFLVAIRNGRYEIVEASQDTINAKTEVVEEVVEEEADTNED